MKCTYVLCMQTLVGLLALGLAAGQEDAAGAAPTIVREFNEVKEDGSYIFGYEASDGTFKIETKDPKGNLKGT